MILLFAIATVAAKAKRSVELWKSRLTLVFNDVLRPTDACESTSGRRTVAAIWLKQEQLAHQTKK